MKQKLSKLLKFTPALIFLALPLSAAAQAVQQGLQSSRLQNSFGFSGLNSASSLSELIVGVVNLLLIFAGSIAVIFVIIGGYQYVTSGGNEESAEKGRKTLVNAIIGIVIIVLAYVIINVISNLVGNGYA